MDSIKKFRFKIIKNFLDGFELKLFQQYCRCKLRFADPVNISWPLTKEDEQNTEAANAYKITYKYDVIMESLLECKRKLVEEESGLQLFSSYSVWRPYQIASDVAPSKRNDAKEISLILNVETIGQAWPLYLDNKPIIIEPGDACVFLDECNPYRKEFDGTYTSQVELYYVDQNGPHKDCKYNKREYIGSPYENS